MFRSDMHFRHLCEYCRNRRKPEKDNRRSYQEDYRNPNYDRNINRGGGRQNYQPVFRSNSNNYVYKNGRGRPYHPYSDVRICPTTQSAGDTACDLSSNPGTSTKECQESSEPNTSKRSEEPSKCIDMRKKENAAEEDPDLETTKAIIVDLLRRPLCSSVPSTDLLVISDDEELSNRSVAKTVECVTEPVLETVNNSEKEETKEPKCVENSTISDKIVHKIKDSYFDHLYKSGSKIGDEFICSRSFKKQNQTLIDHHKPEPNTSKHIKSRKTIEENTIKFQQTVDLRKRLESKIGKDSNSAGSVSCRKSNEDPSNLILDPRLSVVKVLTSVGKVDLKLVEKSKEIINLRRFKSLDSVVNEEYIEPSRIEAVEFHISAEMEPTLKTDHKPKRRVSLEETKENITKKKKLVEAELKKLKEDKLRKRTNSTNQPEEVSESRRQSLDARSSHGSTKKKGNSKEEHSFSKKSKYSDEHKNTTKQPKQNQSNASDAKHGKNEKYKRILSPESGVDDLINQLNDALHETTEQVDDTSLKKRKSVVEVGPTDGDINSVKKKPRPVKPLKNSSLENLSEDDKKHKSTSRSSQENSSEDERKCVRHMKDEDEKTATKKNPIDKSKCPSKVQSRRESTTDYVRHSSSRRRSIQESHHQYGSSDSSERSSSRRNSIENHQNGSVDIKSSKKRSKSGRDKHSSAGNKNSSTADNKNSCDQDPNVSKGITKKKKETSCSKPRKSSESDNTRDNQSIIMKLFGSDDANNSVENSGDVQKTVSDDVDQLLSTLMGEDGVNANLVQVAEKNDASSNTDKLDEQYDDLLSATTEEADIGFDLDLRLEEDGTTDSIIEDETTMLTDVTHCSSSQNIAVQLVNTIENDIVDSIAAASSREGANPQKISRSENIAVQLNAAVHIQNNANDSIAGASSHSTCENIALELNAVNTSENNAVDSIAATSSQEVANFQKMIRSENIPVQVNAAVNIQNNVNDSIPVASLEERTPIRMSYEEFHRRCYPLFDNIYKTTTCCSVLKNRQKSNTCDICNVLDNDINDYANELTDFLESVEVYDFDFQIFFQNILTEIDYRRAMETLLFVLAQLKTVRSSFGKLFHTKLSMKCAQFSQLNKLQVHEVINILSNIDNAKSVLLLELLASLNPKMYKAHLKAEQINEVFTISDDSDDCCIIEDIPETKKEVKEEIIPELLVAKTEDQIVPGIPVAKTEDQIIPVIPVAKEQETAVIFKATDSGASPVVRETSVTARASASGDPMTGTQETLVITEANHSGDPMKSIQGTPDIDIQSGSAVIGPIMENQSTHYDLPILSPSTTMRIIPDHYVTPIPTINLLQSHLVNPSSSENNDQPISSASSIRPPPAYMDLSVNQQLNQQQNQQCYNVPSNAITDWFPYQNGPLVQMAEMENNQFRQSSGAARSNSQYNTTVQRSTSTENARYNPPHAAYPNHYGGVPATMASTQTSFYNTVTPGPSSRSYNSTPASVHYNTTVPGRSSLPQYSVDPRYESSPPCANSVISGSIQYSSTNAANRSANSRYPNMERMQSVPAATPILHHTREAINHSNPIPHNSNPNMERMQPVPAATTIPHHTRETINYSNPIPSNSNPIYTNSNPIYSTPVPTNLAYPNRSQSQRPFYVSNGNHQIPLQELPGNRGNYKTKSTVQNEQRQMLNNRAQSTRNEQTVSTPITQLNCATLNNQQHNGSQCQDLLGAQQVFNYPPREMNNVQMNRHFVQNYFQPTLNGQYPPLQQNPHAKLTADLQSAQSLHPVRTINPHVLPPKYPLHLKFRTEQISAIPRSRDQVKKNKQCKRGLPASPSPLPAASVSPSAVQSRPTSVRTSPLVVHSNLSPPVVQILLHSNLSPPVMQTVVNPNVSAPVQQTLVHTNVSPPVIQTELDSNLSSSVISATKITVTESLRIPSASASSQYNLRVTPSRVLSMPCLLSSSPNSDESRQRSPLKPAIVPYKISADVKTNNLSDKVAELVPMPMQTPMDTWTAKFQKDVAFHTENPNQNVVATQDVHNLIIVTHNNESENEQQNNKQNTFLEVKRKRGRPKKKEVLGESEKPRTKIVPVRTGMHNIINNVNMSKMQCFNRSLNKSKSRPDTTFTLDCNEARESPALNNFDAEEIVSSDSGCISPIGSDAGYPKISDVPAHSSKFLQEDLLNSYKHVNYQITCICGNQQAHLVCECKSAIYCSASCQLLDWPKHGEAHASISLEDKL